MLWALVAVLVGSGCGESAEVTQPSATPPTSSPQAAITAHVSSNVALSAEQGAKVFVFLRRPGEHMPLGELVLPLLKMTAASVPVAIFATWAAMHGRWMAGVWPLACCRCRWPINLRGLNGLAS